MPQLMESKHKGETKPYTASRVTSITQLRVPHRGLKGLKPTLLLTISQPGTSGPNPQNWQTYSGKRVDTHGFMDTLSAFVEAARYQGYEKVLIWGLAGTQEEKTDVWGSVTSNTQMRRYWTSAMNADFDTFINFVKNKLGMPVGLYRGEDNMPVMYVNGSYVRWNTGSANPNFSGNEWETESNRDLLVTGMAELAQYFDFFGGDAVYYVSLYRTAAFLDFMAKITRRGYLYIHEGMIADTGEGISEANKLEVHSYCPEIGVADTGSSAPSDIINGNPQVALVKNTARRQLLTKRVPGFRQMLMFNGSGQNDTAPRRAQTLELLRFCREYNVVPVGNFDLSVYRGQW